MGWFLTRKSNKRSKSRKHTSLMEPQSWDPQRTLMGLKLLGAFALAVALIIGWRYAERAMLEYAKTHSPVREVTSERIELIDAPSWMSDAIQQQIRACAAQPISPDPMDGWSLRLAAKNLQHNPWIEQVRQVERRSDGRIEVRADYRRPVAIVEARDGYHLIDRNAVCLPGVYGEHQAYRLGLIILANAASPPPPEAGQTWPGEDVMAGLELIRLMEEEPCRVQVREIDLGQRDARGRLWLVLNTNLGPVQWGLPPGQGQGIDTDPRLKLRRLNAVTQAGLPALAAGEIIDVSGPAPGTLSR